MEAAVQRGAGDEKEAKGGRKLEDKKEATDRKEQHEETDR